MKPLARLLRIFVIVNHVGKVMIWVLTLSPLAGRAQLLAVPRTDSVSRYAFVVVKPPHYVYTPSIGVLPMDFYAKHLGFFCRQELKMREIHVPVTFRVGTMDQCNYLEQKPGYR